MDWDGGTGPINLGNPEELTILELAELVNELTGNRGGIQFQPLPADDPIRRRPEITKAREYLGWKPEVSLREGLGLTISYFDDCLTRDRVGRNPAQ
jgi:nucleoside-diphosphate-sugar epimerase